ncbi:MAG: DUF4038 domain-containing protein [Lachnospiraceae bacterium]|nr:DUF4038 domain-containing protein [Lachnospiraceae bacterium]
MEKLRISGNRRYFENAAGEPFVWLADTVWTMPQRMRWDDVDLFMRERKKQGFTVLQICALDPERDEGMHDPAGNPALIDNDLSKPNEEYFRYLDYVLDTAERYGFYVLLLPVWGQLVVGSDWSGNTFEKTVTLDNAYGYGCFIGERYKDRTNILWCLGGDRQPVHAGVDYKDVWRRMAEGLAKGVTGKDLKWNLPDPAWEEICITYHTNYEMETGACSTMCHWTDEEAWLSFIMLQTGHSPGSRSWAWVRREYDRENAVKTFRYSPDYQVDWDVPVTGPQRRMPVWDGEPYYERGLEDCALTRHRAYWDMLAGSFGFTYGNWSVWSSVYQKDRMAGLMANTWYEALSSVGSGQMKHLRAFMENFRIMTAAPCQEILGAMADGGAAPEPDHILFSNRRDIPIHHMQAAVSADGKRIFVYFPLSGSAELDLSAAGSSQFNTPSVYLWWYDPRSGRFTGKEAPASGIWKPVSDETPVCDCVPVREEKISVMTPAGNPRASVSNPLDTDWVLVISAEPCDVPFTEPESYWTPDETGAGEKKKTVFF